MKQALEALEYANATCKYENERQSKAIADLREAIAQAEKAEPVALVGAGFQLLWARHDWSTGIKVGDKLYITTPAAQPTATFDEVFDAIDWDLWRSQPIRELVRMIHGKTTPPAQQAPTVPAFNGPATRKLADLQAQGWQINGYHLQRTDGGTWKHCAITSGGMVLWWHGKMDGASAQRDHLDDRAAFEAFVKSEMGDIAVMDAGRYISPKIQKYWRVWEAARSTTP
jgi:hypothetical protein